MQFMFKQQQMYKGHICQWADRYVNDEDQLVLYSGDKKGWDYS